MIQSDRLVAVGDRIFVRHPGPIHEHWKAASLTSGFEIICRVQDKDHLVIECHKCGECSIKRRNVVVEHTPDCRPCIERRRRVNAQAAGARYLGIDPEQGCKIGRIELKCGHIVSRAHIRVQQAAEGGHKLGCDVCREARYAAEADAVGWRLIGDPDNGQPGYRRYEHDCGHHQDAAIANVYWGALDCGRCSQTYLSKPSTIYVFAIDVPDKPMLKLGYSHNPRRRLRYQLGIPKDVPTRILRVVAMPTGQDAEREETATHRALRRDHPDWVMEPDDYRAWINTQGEIYHAAAQETIDTMLDEIEGRYRDDP